MSAIPEPLSTIDWSTPAVIRTQVHGHIESRYDAASGKWTEPKLVTDPYLKIHGLSPGLHYGQQCYEGLKAFRTPQNTISIFRPFKHASRFANSCATVSLPPVPESHFVACVQAAVLANAAYVPPHESGAMLYIRPVAFGTGEGLGLTAPPETMFCVFVKPMLSYHGLKALDAVVIDGFDRAAPRGVGAAKVGGNYAPVIRWAEAAKAQGFGLTLHLDSATHTEIDEFSTSAFMGVKRSGAGDVTLVVADSPSIVDSVTSASCMVLARSLGWTVEKRTVKYAELGDFTEVMAAGSAASLVPVRSITRKSTDDVFNYTTEGDHGAALCQALSKLMDETTRGKRDDEYGWLFQLDNAAGQDLASIEEQAHKAAKVNGARENGVRENGARENGKVQDPLLAMGLGRRSCN